MTQSSDQKMLNVKSLSSAVANDETAGGACQGGDSGGRCVGGGGRGGRHPVHQELALPGLFVLCAHHFRRTGEGECGV